MDTTTAQTPGQILNLPAKSAQFFADLAEDAANWGGNPWFDGNVSAGRSAAGMVGRLVKAGLIVSADYGDGQAYAVFTHQGVAAAAKLGIDLSWIEKDRLAGEPIEQPAPAARHQLQTVPGPYGRPVAGIEFRMPAAKHNGSRHNFQITMCNLTGNCCGQQSKSRPGHAGRLSAQPTVISRHKVGETPALLDLAPGDVLEIDGKLYEVRDDVPLHDPRLYAI